VAPTVKPCAIIARCRATSIATALCPRVPALRVDPRAAGPPHPVRCCNCLGSQTHSAVLCECVGLYGGARPPSNTLSDSFPSMRAYVWTVFVVGACAVLLSSERRVVLCDDDESTVERVHVSEALGCVCMLTESAPRSVWRCRMSVRVRRRGRCRWCGRERRVEC
jgi:hypothetical protein